MTIKLAIAKPHSILSIDDYDTAYDFLDGFIAENFSEGVVHDGGNNVISIELNTNEDGLPKEIEMAFNSYFNGELECAVC